MAESPQKNPWLERPWFPSEHDGRVYVTAPHVVVCEIVPSQLGGVTPRLSTVNERLEIASTICRAVNLVDAIKNGP